MQATLSYFSERLAGVSSQTLQLAPQNSNSATANQQIRIALPSSSILNMRSCKLLLNVTTAGGGARLPPISHLIDRYELSAGGSIIAQGCHLTNVLVAARAVLNGSKCDSTLGHPEYVRAKSYVTGVEINGTDPEVYSDANGQTQFCINLAELPGYFESIEPSLQDMSLAADTVLTLFTAGNEVLSSCAGTALSIPTGGGLTGLTITADGAKDASYTMKNIRFQCEVIGFASATIDELIARRMSSVGYVESVFKSYQSFPDVHNASTKFNCASQSLDKIYVVQRPTNFDTQGGLHRVPGYKTRGAFTSAAAIPATQTAGAVVQDIGVPTYDIGGVLNTNSERYVGKYFKFTQAGADAKYSLRINGTYIPSTPLNATDMFAMSMNSVDKSYQHSLTLHQYLDSFFVQAFSFGLPNDSVRFLDGVDSRGISLQGSYETTGVTAGTPVVLWTESTSSLRQGVGRSSQVIN